ncbi:MAG: hypothetical protein GY861_05625 [bacterium]|nr:hypothetical protein [bacterium]
MNHYKPSTFICHNCLGEFFTFELGYRGPERDDDVGWNPVKNDTIHLCKTCDQVVPYPALQGETAEDYPEPKSRQIVLLRELNSNLWLTGTSCYPELVEFKFARMFAGAQYARQFLWHERCKHNFVSMNIELINYTLTWDEMTEVEWLL